MPFHQPYATSFARGDLVYGLSDGLGRKPFTEQLGVPGDVPYFIDHFVRPLPGRPAPKGYAFPDKRTIRNFFRSMHEHPKYSRFARDLARFDYHEDLYHRSTGSLFINDGLRAKIKFGLEHQVRKQRSKVHFVLDNIDMHRVATKSGPGEMKLEPDDPSSGERALKLREFTGAELRWIRRFSADPRVRNAVQFWATPPEGGAMRPVGPPWENEQRRVTNAQGRETSWKQAWEAYRPSGGIRDLPPGPLPRRRSTCVIS